MLNNFFRKDLISKRRIGFWIVPVFSLNKGWVGLGLKVGGGIEKY